MGKITLLLLLAWASSPAFADEPVTVEQLGKLLVSAHGMTDEKVARQLSELTLTERLSAVTFSRLEAELPGPESRRSLGILADVSAFLDLPAAEIPNRAAPDIAAQRQVLTQTVSYVSKTIHQLPDFSATRHTAHFKDSAPVHSAKVALVPSWPLHPIGESADTVLFRDGNEVVDSGLVKGNGSQSEPKGLIFSGIFGPLLGLVFVDAAQSKLAWSHWEQGMLGPQAIFRYMVPVEKSHYKLRVCCTPFVAGDHVFQETSGYHGEIAIDPTNGTVLRVTLIADSTSTDLISRSKLLVEYGPVEIEGKSYICPIKTVAITTTPEISSSDYEIGWNHGVFLDNHGMPPGDLYPLTLLNEVIFDQYQSTTRGTRIPPGKN